MIAEGTDRSFPGRDVALARRDVVAVQQARVVARLTVRTDERIARDRFAALAGDELSPVDSRSFW